MLALILLAAAAASTPTDPKMDAVIAFGNSMSYPVQVKTCSKVSPALKVPLKAALSQWVTANAAQIRMGHETISQEGAATGTDTIGMIRYMQSRTQAEFKLKPVEEQMQRCEALLGELQQPSQ